MTEQFGQGYNIDIQSRNDHDWDEGMSSWNALDTRLELTITPVLRQEAAYWGYLVQHPCHTSLPRRTLEDTIALLTFYTAGKFRLNLVGKYLTWSTDRIINPEDSVAVFSKDTAQQLLDLARSLREDEDIFKTVYNEPLKTLILSRLMERIGSSCCPCVWLAFIHSDYS
jgi:hypothetical protein